MKKTNVFLVMVCLVGIWATSCVKDNETVNTKMGKTDKTSTAQLLNQFKAGTFSGSYMLYSNIGHKSSLCGGKCTYSNGVWIHANCQGYGNECSFNASVNISKNVPEDSTDIYYNAIGINNYEPIEESTFNMPARSLYIRNDEYDDGFIYLNIPAQILYRDEFNNQFIYRDITFTISPLFENL